VGSGVGDYHKETFVFCLDAKTGKPLWRHATAQPVWGQPTVRDGHVYIGTGNGRLNEEPDKAAGSVLCLCIANGERLWEKKLGDAVFGRVGVDERYAYFGCRDGHAYCLERGSGRLVWRRRFGSAVGTSPALARSGCHTTGLYVVALRGQVACLGPRTGRIHWGTDLAAEASAQPELFSSPGLEVRPGTGEEVRRLYVGVTLQSAGRTAQLRCYEDSRRVE
jgi:outer membrane protein assembly factor BamB